MPKKQIKVRGGRKSFVTVDLDMTVADHRRRLKKACVGGVIDRDVLFSASLILEDKVIAGAAAALMQIRKHHSIVFLSARTRRVSGVTKKWLQRHKLFKPGDRLMVVDSEAEKLKCVKRLLPELYAIIDDFKYDYQSGRPRLSNYLLPELLNLNAPVIVFDRNWRHIMRTYF
jgi:hypothetical protein